MHVQISDADKRSQCFHRCASNHLLVASTHSTVVICLYPEEITIQYQQQKTHILGNDRIISDDGCALMFPIAQHSYLISLWPSISRPSCDACHHLHTSPDTTSVSENGLYGTQRECDNDLRFFALRGNGLVSQYHHRQTNNGPSVCVTLGKQARRDNVPIQIERVVLFAYNTNTHTIINHAAVIARIGLQPARCSANRMTVKSVIKRLIAIDSGAPGAITT